MVNAHDLLQEVLKQFEEQFVMLQKNPHLSKKTKTFVGEKLIAAKLSINKLVPDKEMKVPHVTYIGALRQLNNRGLDAFGMGRKVSMHEWFSFIFKFGLFCGNIYFRKSIPNVVL